ncbi:hypothetical protein [Nonomuraea dietziae]|uniref:hypothetical protein n=1 Tax=Nonomuraea dietziae TaxID=65515 RepID=UPI0031D7C232
MSDFTQAVAKRAGVNADQAADVLARHGVRESGILPKPHRLLITSIAFTGKKSGTSTGSINFEWHLASGLWCLAADNLRGKSSVLEVIWWCLRGESNLQADVRRWIHRVRLTGQVDDEPFTVAVDAVDDQLIGSLEIGAQGQATNFTGEQEFSATMGAFMMDRLGLEPLRGWRRDTAGSPAEPEEADGQLTVTGWPAYSHALMCRNRENDALLGETAAGGTMISLLQMFVGLPWTTTRRDASAALEVLRQGLRGERRRAQQDLDARGIGVEELEKRLAEAKRVAAQMDVRSLETAVGDVETLGAKLTEMTARHAELVQQSSIAQQQADDLRETLTADRSRLRDLRETAVAQRFFGALKPTCCPRCSTTLDKLAHADLGELHCGLCGSEPTAPLGDNGAAEELAAAIDILQGAYREARQAAQQTAAAVQASSATLEAIRTAFRDAQGPGYRKRLPCGHTWPSRGWKAL